MANPTGSTYLQANSFYTWVDGDIYEIIQTDQQEEAATGASFAGLGVDNQPHQVLLNKVQYTHAKQLIDETNITILQAFMALFTCKMGVNGYIELGAQDVSLGQIQPIVQWGMISLVGAAGSSQYLYKWRFPFNFPLTFPNAIYALYPYWLANLSGSQDSSSSADVLSLPWRSWMLEATTPLQRQGNSLLVLPQIVDIDQPR